MNEPISTEFKTEGQAFPVENEEKENSADSSPGEQTNAEQTQPQEGEQNSGEQKDDGDGQKKDAGFADDPRWQQREDDWKERFNDQEKRHVEEINRLREEFTGQFKESNKESTESAEIPEWFNGDEHQWAAFTKHNQGLIDQAVQKALKTIHEGQTQEQKAIDTATSYFKQEVDKLETDKAVNPKGIKIDRNKLLKLAMDEDLVDSQGRWNWKVAVKMYLAGVTTAPKTQTSDEKKRIANASISDNRAETKQEPVTTSADFEKPGRRPW